jgi:hypothetical protein
MGILWRVLQPTKVSFPFSCMCTPNCLSCSKITCSVQSSWWHLLKRKPTVPVVCQVQISCNFSTQFFIYASKRTTKGQIDSSSTVAFLPITSVMDHNLEKNYVQRCCSPNSNVLTCSWFQQSFLKESEHITVWLCVNVCVCVCTTVCVCVYVFVLV